MRRLAHRGQGKNETGRCGHWGVGGEQGIWRIGEWGQGVIIRDCGFFLFLAREGYGGRGLWDIAVIG
jgi:hypothetical protein